MVSVDDVVEAAAPVAHAVRDGGVGASDRLAFLKDLAKFGPRHSTSVVVNGRPMLLDAALRLAAAQPAGTVMTRRYRYVSISPDPLREQHGQAGAPPEQPWIPPTAELVRRLLDAQRAADRRAAEARRRGWGRLGRLLGGAPC